MKISTLFIAGITILPVFSWGQAQPAATPPGGPLVGVVQWLPMVADLGKAEEFFHGLMGLESLNGDPRMRLDWYATIPFLQDMYANKGNMRNFQLRIPGSDMGIEPIQWSEGTGKVATSRLQDPGAGHLILKTWNIDGLMARIEKGGATVLTAGGMPVRVAGANGANRVVWLREPNGFFIALEQLDPLPPVPRNNGALPPSYYVGAEAGFTVQDMDKTVRFYRDVLGFQVQPGEWMSASDQLAAFGTPGGEYRTAFLKSSESPQTIRLIEFRNLNRTPMQKRIFDPNSLVLRIRVRGIDALAAKLKAEGAKVVSVGGAPYPNGPTRWFMVEGPDNVFAQLMEAPQNPPAR